MHAMTLRLRYRTLKLRALCWSCGGCASAGRSGGGAGYIGQILDRRRVLFRNILILLEKIANVLPSLGENF
jgi:hypothetical protein